jgi:hypothetical protein
MAGRYQGRHVFQDLNGHQLGIEVFWGQDGWFWRADQLNANAVGPFTTSSEAYGSARATCHREVEAEGPSSLRGADVPRSRADGS